ncbi:MAG: cupin domain-containing protein [Candidatus Marinimicrobia bacterium]|nr:cupin domain-containing protein [Candidatus Neomarinimicrobiota bacterium]MBL7022515.1 cupin domain-containing protein [Candidatus Neomarinimicrobiota bacterium]MBL7108630.1 cupin domain-containing protein [Candidatus Neomarinimicrobiota bacterium]
MRIIKQILSEDEIKSQDIYNWPIWTCDISEFDWEYDDRESCLIIEGEVEVTTDIEVVKFGVGDFIIFPKGLKCRWKVIQPIRKHYNFG